MWMAINTSPRKTCCPRQGPEQQARHAQLRVHGADDLSNYTIQADVLLTEEGGKISDVGLINSGYQLTIRGMNRKLRIDSWTTTTTARMPRPISSRSRATGTR